MDEPRQRSPVGRRETDPGEGEPGAGRRRTNTKRPAVTGRRASLALAGLGGAGGAVGRRASVGMGMNLEELMGMSSGRRGSVLGGKGGRRSTCGSCWPGTTTRT